jgi:hypothetical protein
MSIADGGMTPLPPLPPRVSAEQATAARREQAQRLQRDVQAGEHDAPPAGQHRGSGRAGVRQMKDRLREQGRELADLRRELDRYRAGAAEPEPAPVPDGADSAPADGVEPVTAEQVAVLEAEVAELRRLPVGVAPEHIAAHKLSEQAAAQALPHTDGLEGQLARLRDRSVSWPQLQEEMRAMGWRDPAEATSWDRPTP